MSAKGHVVRFMVIELGAYTGDPIECYTTAASLTPSSSDVTTTTACPSGTITDSKPASWTFDLQLNATEGNTELATWLIEHEGESAAVVWTPNAAVPTFGWSFTVTIKPPALNYTVGEFAGSPVSLAVTGKPVKVDPTTP